MMPRRPLQMVGGANRFVGLSHLELGRAALWRREQRSGSRSNG